MMFKLLISQNELWLKSIFKNPADFSIVSWYKLIFLNLISRIAIPNTNSTE